MSNTIIVKIRDRGSSFYDISSDTSIGNELKEVKHTEIIDGALRGGALIRPTDHELKNFNKKEPTDYPEHVLQSPLNEHTVNSLRKMLDEHGITYSASDKKSDLVAILEAHRVTAKEQLKD